MKTPALLALIVIALAGNLLLLDKIKTLKHPTVKTPNRVCGRTQPYPIDPKISISLDKVLEKNEKARELKNCLSITYEDINADKEEKSTLGNITLTSNTEKVEIRLDNRFKNLPEPFAQPIIAHEIQHELDHLDSLNNGRTISCVQSEVNAFRAAQEHFKNMSPSEKLEMLKPLYFRNMYYSTGGQFLFELEEIENNPPKPICEDTINKLILKKVKEIYVEQCNLKEGETTSSNYIFDWR